MANTYTYLMINGTTMKGAVEGTFICEKYELDAQVDFMTFYAREAGYIEFIVWLDDEEEEVYRWED